MRKTNIVIFLLLLIALFFFSIYFIFNHTLNKEIINPNKVIISLPYGTSTDKIVKIFNENGYFEPDWLFKIILKYEYKKRKRFIEAGTYEIPESISNKDLIEKLFSKELITHNRLTIIEGSNIFQVAHQFHNQLNIDSLKVINLLQSPVFAKKLGLNVNTLEGYLMPETYFFLNNTPVEKIIELLVRKQLDILKTIKENKNINLSDYNILKLASIIQAETSVVDEMPLISSVYHNRLQRGMLLQADPTILYFIYPRKTITKSDLNLNNPYNTYKNFGLPPTPINSPGRNAIYAAINPENTTFYYFVAKMDSTKTHFFASNYSEHLLNVKKYLKNK
ncbi:MAG: endolytic transglycosylase MltG [Candidatus Kapaibacteriota bacterium]